MMIGAGDFSTIGSLDCMVGLGFWVGFFGIFLAFSVVFSTGSFFCFMSRGTFVSLGLDFSSLTTIGFLGESGCGLLTCPEAPITSTEMMLGVLVALSERLDR